MAATLTPSATVGRNIPFTASEACFVVADVGRQIIFGASRAIIISFGISPGDVNPNVLVHADIIDAFPNTQPIPADAWFLRLSPQSDLTPTVVAPVGTKIVLNADRHTFRNADFGKFIHIYGGVVEVQGVISTTQVFGEILSVLQVEEISAGSGTYPAAIAGTWTLEISSWSTATGFPRSGEFAQGRLGQISTTAQPTTVWLSAPDSYDNYATGIKADDALEYTVASRYLNRLEWIGENLDDILIGSSGAELLMTSGKTSEPFGGDVIPKVNPLSNIGSAPIQSITLDDKQLFIDRSRRQIFVLAYSVETDRKIPIELTAIAEHMTESGIKLGPIAYQKRLDRRLYFVRNDGVLVVLTYFPNEKVSGFVRITTDGLFEAVCAVAQGVGKADLVYVIVQRTINGVVKRFLEVFDEDIGATSRSWATRHTDCGGYYNGTPTNFLLGLDHLEGKSVDVVANGGFRGAFLVTAGRIDFQEEYSQIEWGLHYEGVVTTMRPAIEGTVLEGLMRSWTKLYARLFKSLGGKINGEAILYPPSTLDSAVLFTGDRETTAQPGVDQDGRVTIMQDQPYPMTLLSIFGTLEVSEHD